MLTITANDNVGNVFVKTVNYRVLDATNVDGSAGGTVPATLALTLGAPATFGAFTPGVDKDYTASTTANVISTAGDATLSVADPSATATGHLVNGAFSLPAGAAGQGDQRRRHRQRVRAVGGSAARRRCSPTRPGLQRRRDDRVPAARSAPTTRCAPAPTARR